MRMDMNLKNRILFISLTPLLIVGIAVIVITSTRTTSSMEQEVGKTLKSNAIFLVDTLEIKNEGDFNLNEDGELYKGDYKLSEIQEFVDDIKGKTEVDLTICYGDTRYITTIRNEDKSLAIGTQLSSAIVDLVIRKGESVLKDGVNVNGKQYYGYYTPIFNGDRKSVV